MRSSRCRRSRVSSSIRRSTINRWMNQRVVTVQLNFSGRDLLSLWLTPRSRSPKRSLRSDEVSTRMGRRLRESAPRGGAIHSDHGPGSRADDGSALRRVRAAAPQTLLIPRRRAAGDAGRADRPVSHGQYSQRRLEVGFIALFGVAVLNGVIMVANLNRMREQGQPLFRGGAGWRRRTAAAGSDDGSCRHGGDAAGGAGDGGLAAMCSAALPPSSGRPHPGDPADAVHHPDVLFRHRAVGRTAGACERAQTAPVSG